MKPKIGKKIQKAILHFKQGQLKKADELLNEIIIYDSLNFEALYLKGTVCGNLGKHAKSIIFFIRAEKLDPKNAFLQHNLANAFLQIGQNNTAITHYQRAVKLMPTSQDIWLAFGKCLFNQNLYVDALNCYDKAIELKPDFIEAFYNRGHVYKVLNRLEEALSSYGKAIELKPDYADAYYNRGVLLNELNCFDEALENYNKVIALNTFDIDAYFNRGNIYQELRRLEEALSNYNKVIELKIDDADAYMNRGNVLRDLNRLDEALASYDKAIEFKGNFALAYSNRGNVLKELKRFEEALASFDKAIEINPGDADTYWNKSILLLSLSDFVNGWTLYYEWRWKAKSFGYLMPMTNKPKLINLGSIPYSNKKLLILAEQGIGDQVLYAGMLDQLLSISLSCQVMLDKRLLTLFKRSFPRGRFLDKNIPVADIEHDEYLYIGDLGKYFKTCLSDFDLSRKNYLKSDRLKANEIRNSLIKNKKYLCGVSWSSSAINIGTEKTIQLEDLLIIFAIKEIQFVSLQYGDVRKQLAEFNSRNNLNIKESLSVDNFYDIDGHAALIEACDFVITISNTSAHISGAIGKETYLMLSSGKGALWYWSNQLNRKSLWYPSIYIYEQSLPGQWVDVVKKIKLDIEKKINEIE
jgi:tetratricopeptide (TPR) repeat protein